MTSFTVISHTFALKWLNLTTSGSGVSVHVQLLGLARCSLDITCRHISMQKNQSMIICVCVYVDIQV